MESVISYLTENPVLGIAVAVVSLSIIVSIVRSLFKFAMVIAVAGLIMVVFLDFQPEEVIDKGKNIANIGSEILDGEFIPYLTELLVDEEIVVEEKDGQTTVDMESLAEKYNLDELLNRLSKDEQLKLEDILESE